MNGSIVSSGMFGGFIGGVLVGIIFIIVVCHEEIAGVYTELKTWIMQKTHKSCKNCIHFIPDADVYSCLCEYGKPLKQYYNNINGEWITSNRWANCKEIFGTKRCRYKKNKD
jgi:hypothetical protein